MENSRLKTKIPSITNDQEKSSSFDTDELLVSKGEVSYEIGEVVDEGSITKPPPVPLTKEELKIRSALLARAYHLPGNNYSQDLLQFLVNHHPLFSIFFHHPLHPVSRGMHAAAFLGSIVFGLATTNIIYLAFVMEDKDFDRSFLKVNFSNSTTGTEELDMIVDQFTQVDVTAGILTLWTVGAALNAFFDNLIWTVAACACCLSGGCYEHLEKYRKYIPFLVIFVVVGVTAIATLAVLIVAASESNQENEEVATELGLSFNRDAEAYRFLLAYTVEIALSLFVYYPLLGTLLFSGAFGCCGKLRILGGRAQEMRKIEEREQIISAADTSEM